MDCWSKSTRTRTMRCSDGAQSLHPEQFTELMQQLKLIAQAVDRTL